MEYLFLLRSQVHELRMCQMVEEINFSRHAIEGAVAKYKVLTRKTVTQLSEHVGLRLELRQAPNKCG
jgi:tryptophan 2,3-dioxygenase